MFTNKLCCFIRISVIYFRKYSLFPNIMLNYKRTKKVSKNRFNKQKGLEKIILITEIKVGHIVEDEVKVFRYFITVYFSHNE